VHRRAVLGGVVVYNVGLLNWNRGLLYWTRGLLYWARGLLYWDRCRRMLWGVLVGLRRSLWGLG